MGSEAQRAVSGPRKGPPRSQRVPAPLPPPLLNYARGSVDSLKSEARKEGHPGRQGPYPASSRSKLGRLRPRALRAASRAEICGSLSAVHTASVLQLQSSSSPRAMASASRAPRTRRNAKGSSSALGRRGPSSIRLPLPPATALVWTRPARACAPPPHGSTLDPAPPWLVPRPD